MAHFAQIDDTNTVFHVIVVDNSKLLDETGNENESLGIAFLQSIFGANSRWVQTSYNNRFRGRYAGIGFTYDPVLDVFVDPQESS